MFYENFNLKVKKVKRDVKQEIIIKEELDDDSNSN